MFSNSNARNTYTTMTQNFYLKGTILFLAILFCLMFSFLPVSAKETNTSGSIKLSTTKTGFTSKGKLQLKKKASKKGKTVITIPKNKECTVLKSYTNGWSLVKYSNKKGYAKTNKLSIGKEAEQLIQQMNQVCLGLFRITAYCNCAKCCGRWAGSSLSFSHRLPQEGFTISVDPSVIPLGSYVLIDGHIYYAEDTGVHGNSVDIFCSSHGSALSRGMHYSNVILLKNYRG